MNTSGTAISLAEDIIETNPEIENWVNNKTPGKHEINIHSKREGEVPGIHTIKYESEVDYIAITHSAKSRKGLALGAVMAAEFSLKNKGILTMKNLLNI